MQHTNINLGAEDADSFARFSALVRPLFSVYPMQEGMPFGAKVSTTAWPDVLFTRTEADGTTYERVTNTIVQSGSDDIVVLVDLSAPFTCQVNERMEFIDTNDIVFLDLGQTVRIQAEKVDTISMVITRQRLAEISSTVSDIHGFVLRSGATRDLLLSHMRTCIEVGNRIPTVEASIISDVTIRMVAATWHNVKRRASSTTRHSGLASMREIKQYIEEHLSDPQLGPPMLLKEFHLSRATLYRMFKPIGGVAAFILERRLHKALQIMSTLEAEKPLIKQLAMSLGFQHASVFSRSFKKQFGASPQTLVTHTIDKSFN